VLWYGLGAAPIGIHLTAVTFVVFFYNQVVGVSGAVVGAAFAASLVFDAVTDPLAGTISDRTRSRLGRRHPYLLGSAVPGALLVALIWLPPTDWLGPVGLGIWLTVVLLAQRLVSTFFVVPYYALGAELSTGYEERTRIVATRQNFMNAARGIAGGALLLWFLRPTPDYPDGQLNPAGYPVFGILVGSVTLVAILLSALQTRSRIPHLTTPSTTVASTSALRTVVTGLLEALRYRSFRAFLLGHVAGGVAWGMSDALGLYMATYFWQIDTSLLFVWGIGMFGGFFIGVPMWRRLAVGRDKKPLYMTGLGLYILFFCTPYLLKANGIWPEQGSPFDFPLYVLTTGLLAHVAISSGQALGGSMLGDVTDLDELETGQRREGLILGAESFGWKAVSGLGPLLAGLVVDAVGIETGMTPETAPPEIGRKLGLALGTTMVTLLSLGWLALSRYDLTRERHAAIRARLDNR
jgi:Na+/melibiose symporter-like transporter